MSIPEAQNGPTFDYDGPNPFEERKKEEEEKNNKAEKENEALSEAEKTEKDKILFRSIFVGLIKSPNIMRKYIIGRPEFNTLSSISIDEPLVCKASDEFYINFMPSIKGLLGPFQFIFEIYDKYEGLISLSAIIFMGCSMEMDAWQKMEAEETKSSKKGDEVEGDGVIIEGESHKVDDENT